MILQYPVRLRRRPYYLGASIFRAGTDIRRDSLYSFLTKLNFRGVESSLYEV